MVKMEQNMKLYSPIIQRIRGQVWDSVADISEFPSGVAIGIFPNNPLLQKATTVLVS